MPLSNKKTDWRRGGPDPYHEERNEGQSIGIAPEPQSIRSRGSAIQKNYFGWIFRFLCTTFDAGIGFAPEERKIAEKAKHLKNWAYDRVLLLTMIAGQKKRSTALVKEGRN